MLSLKGKRLRGTESKYAMKLYTFLLVMSFLQLTSAVELKHKHVIKVKNKSYTCLFKLHYEGNVCFRDSTVTCTPNIRKKAVAKNINLVLEDGTVMSIKKVEVSKKKDKMTGCKVTSRPTPPITIQPTTECYSENSNWKSGIQQLELSTGGSYEQSWAGCGTKCTINDDCHLWQYSKNTSWCWNFAEKGNAKLTVGDDITGRKGCPAEPINRTVTCGFDDDELAGGVRSPVDPHPGFKWAGGIIPYFFTNAVTYNDKEVFKSVMKQIQCNTCFQFQETNTGFRGHHLEIDVGRGTCWPNSYAEVNIDPNNNNKIRLRSQYQLADQRKCDWSGLILHEMMHVLGVSHTQKRRDRDRYITVNYNNIHNTANARHQYDICENCMVYDSIPYECQSIMHYGTKNQRIPGRGPTMNSSTCILGDYGPSVPTANDWNLLRIIARDVCSEGSGCAFTDIEATSACEYWKNQGYCTSGPWINDMHTYCAKTCKCNSGFIFTDNNSNCPAWKEYCSNPWVMSTCPKTCKCLVLQ